MRHLFKTTPRPHRWSKPPGAKPARLRQTGGFTILEVALAAFVLAFGIATSIITMQSGYRQIDLARGTTIAAQILQSEMERLRLMSWGLISALPASATFDGATHFSGNPEIAGKFSVTRTVAANATEPTSVKDLTVSVQWKTYDGRPHKRSFTANYAQNGLYDYYYTVAHP
jgi:Tfp pilus assembly protein PilV